MNRRCHMLAWGLLLSFFTALVYLNLITPLWSDDYVYRFVFDARYYYDESFARLVCSWQDILDSQLAHYLCTNGRAVVHTLAQFFLAFGYNGLWSVANALCFLALGWLLWRFAARSSKGGQPLHPWAGYLLTLACYWLLLPHHGQLYFWLTGSCNYQWAALLVLAFLNLLFLPEPRALAWLLFPVALLAGNSNEALSLGLSLALGCYAIFRREELNLRQYIGLACFFIGTGSNVFSPGVAARLEMAGDSVAHATLLQRCMNAWEDMGTVLTQWPNLLLVPLAAMLLAMWPRGRSRYRAWLLFAALLSLALAVYVRMIDPRASFGYFLYAGTAALPVLFTFVARLPKFGRWGLALLLTLVIGKQMLNAAYDIPRFAAYEQALVDASRDGTGMVVPQQSAPWSRYNHASFLTANSSGMHNRAMAAYYGTPRFGVMTQRERRLLQEVPHEAYASLQPGEYCRATDELFLLRLAEEPTSCHATGYHVHEDDPVESGPRCWRGLPCAVQERAGAHYVLIFFDCSAHDAGLCEMRLRLLQGHELTWLSLNPNAGHGWVIPREPEEEKKEAYVEPAEASENEAKLPDESGRRRGAGRLHDACYILANESSGAGGGEQAFFDIPGRQQAAMR